jgi:beta-glucanase (GH16 family)
VKNDGDAPASIWIEDYVGNPDDRTYNITASMELAPGATEVYKEGSPLNTGTHKMRLHASSGSVSVSSIDFELMIDHQLTPDTLVQNTEGDEWELVWSDEFDGTGAVDESKWTYDVGNWGWGNNEPQYYTANRTENARQEGGNLIIEARKNDEGNPWTSARLTTRGKVSFLYGKLEFRAKAPAGDGTWAAGWLLGDSYRDELSWPYCGEVDILECIGKEIDDETGDGINHASCHTRAYYFKINNHITNTIEVKDMVNTFHTYTAEWDPNEMRMYLDGELYYTYDKVADKLEWPFGEPQDIIINLAMGGGMGGEIDPTIESAQFIVDYVRWYGKK